MKTKDETIARRTLNLVPVTPAAPANQAVMFSDRVKGDELFPELDNPLPPARPIEGATRPAPALHTITCRVCDLPARVPVAAPALLCHACTADLTITRQHLEQTLAVLDERVRAAFDAFNAVLANTEEGPLERWTNAERKIGDGLRDDPAFVATWQRAKAAGGALGAILSAYEAKEDTLATIERARAYATQGLAEVAEAERRDADNAGMR